MVILTQALPSKEHTDQHFMMTSLNENILRITGHLCWEFTGHCWIPRTVKHSFDVSFDLHLNKRLSKQSWGWHFETPSVFLWYHLANGNVDDKLKVVWNIRNWFVWYMRIIIKVLLLSFCNTCLSVVLPSYLKAYSMTHVIMHILTIMVLWFQWPGLISVLSHCGMRVTESYEDNLSL